MARTPRTSGGTRTRTTATTTSRRTPRTSASTRTGQTAEAPHRSFFGSIAHGITHPGISDIAAAVSPPMAAAWAAEHSHIPGLTQAGRASQALFESPLYLAAHPKAGAKNLGTMARGIVETPTALYKASGIDPIVYQATHPFAGARGRRTGLAPGIPGGMRAPRGMKSADTSALNALGALWHATKTDYSQRYGKDWKKYAAKEPLFNVADLLMVAGPATKAASGARALRALTKMGVESEDVLAARRAILDRADDPNWKKLKPHEKVKLVKAEVRQPGIATEGVPRTRQVAVRSGEGEPLVVNQPLSPTPFRRGFQDAGDALAQTFPNLPMAGARSRVVRATARQVSRATERLLASIPGAESLTKLPDAGRTRAFWEHAVPHATDEAGNIVHDHGAVTARLSQLHQALSREYGHPGWEAKVKADFPELGDAIDMAKQRAFGNETLKGLEDAIKYKPNKHYENVITAMHHATQVGEHAIRDTEGFSALRNVQTKLLHQLRVLPEGSDKIPLVHEKLDRVNSLLETKRSFIEQMLNDSRRRVSDYIDTAHVESPERTAWEKHMVRTLKMAPEEAQGALRFSDVMARKFRPEDPKGWYADNVGMPTGESAQQVQSRLGQGGAYWQDFPEAGTTSLIEGDAAAPAGTSAYYSRAQKQIAEAWGKKPYRQAGQVEAGLRKEISADEWRNAGLDNFFKQFGKDEMISQEQLQTHLATTLNKYNLQEIHKVNSEIAKAHGFGTKYDDLFEYGHSQVSRKGRPGEYHEIVFTLPGDEPVYRGTGYFHWDRQQNVVGHVRFHHFEEGGKQKLLIEEVQSDWASDFRKGEGEVAQPALNANRATELAIDRALRYAGENGIDEVIFPDAHTFHARSHAGGFIESNEAADAWEHAVRGRSPAEARKVSEGVMRGEPSQFTRLYERDHPAVAAKRLGVEGTVRDDAYQGHIAEAGGLTSHTGPMRGTVFKLDDAARARAVKPSALYQKQIEWGKVPRGANEVLANGKRQIHMFKNADVSTWIHELSHSAVHDLDAADQAILDAHYGGGKKGIGAWSTASHENYARDFEKFLRTGDLSFVPRAVQDVFQKIQTWMQDTYRALKKANPDEEIPAQVEAVFRRMQTGAPRATRAIGTEVPAREPIFKRNRLALLRSGMIDTNPGHLFEHVNRLVALQKANQIREFLLLHSEPLTHPWGVDFDHQYVIKTAGTNPNKVLYDAIEAADNPAQIREEISKFVDDNILDSKAKLDEAWSGDHQLYVIDKHLTDKLFKYVTGKTPGATTKPMGPIGQGFDAAMGTLRGLLLYSNPGFYVANFAGNFGMQMLNDPRSVKYLKDAVTKRGDLYHQVTAEMGRGPTAGGINPEKDILGREVKGGGFHPDNLPLTASNAFEWWNHKLNVAGRKAGSVVDDPFRYATWRQEASKLGYKSDQQVSALLKQGVKDTREHGFRAMDTKALRDLNKIRDRAEQLMLDFDSMTPFERTYLTRIIFLYPFLKASAKYPFMYAGEHPFTFGALAQTSNVGGQLADQVLGPRPNLPEWAQGYARTPWGMVNVGSIDQMSVLSGELQSVLGVGSPTPVGINRPFNMLHPGIQLAIELMQSRNRYGREAGAGSILKTDAPLPSWMTQLWRQPSSVYSGQNYLDALLRSLRLYPFGVNQNWEPGSGTGG